MNSHHKRSIGLIGLIIALILALGVSTTYYSELEVLNWALTGLLVVSLLGLAIENRKALQTRTAAFGIQTVISILLVFCLLGLANFLAYRYPQEKDFTRSQSNTLSDQTVKIVKSLPDSVTATFYSRQPLEEDFKRLFTRYKGISSKIKIEVVDVFKEPTRAKNSGISAEHSLVLQLNGKQQIVVRPDEEKFTNALIKLVKTRDQTFCLSAGHGEKDFDSKEADGYFIIKQQLERQSYSIKNISIPKEKGIPSECTTLGLIGPTSSLFPQEAKSILDYIRSGGRVLFAIDVSFDGVSRHKEFENLLKSIFIEPINAMIVDPQSRYFGTDASVAPILSFSRTHSITKDLIQQQVKPLYVPFARPLLIGEKLSKGLKATWLAQSTDKSWGETDFKSLNAGQVKPDAGDIKPPHNIAVALEGKIGDDQKTDMRAVVFSSSFFATNQFVTKGANLDFFLNAASWLMKDENMISIRKTDQDSGRLELTAETGRAIFLFVVLLIPLAMTGIGFAIWMRRKKL